MIFNTLSAIFALIGIYISFRIFKEKRSAVMVCPLDSNCQHVLFSKYSKIIGIDIEYFGFLYYLFILIGSVSMIFIPTFPTILKFILIVTTIAGFGFSAYLTMVQAFYIKNWCTWCLSSGLVSTLILASSGYSFHTSVMNGLNIGEVLSEFLPLISLIQLIAVSVGVASITVSSLMTIKFLKDFKIDQREDRKINTVNQITWVSILLLIIVNVSVFTINPVSYLSSAQWITQLFILAVLVFNTAILDLQVQPNLIGLRLDMSSINVFKTLWLRQNAFSGTAISLVSWYIIMLISFFNIGSRNRGVDSINDAAVLISYYISIVIVTVVVSQLATLLADKVKVVRKRKQVSIKLK
jgi:uncharacterized membrane protein